MHILLLHFCWVSTHFSEKYFIREEKKQHDGAFTEALLYLWVAEMLRNSGDKNALKIFWLPSFEIWCVHSDNSGGLCSARFCL